MIASVNPFTGRTTHVFEPHSESEIERRVQLAAATFRRGFGQRAQALERAASILESEKLSFAHIMTEEMGKTLTSAEAEAGKCATVCRYYAENGERALAPIRVATAAAESYYTYQPSVPCSRLCPGIFRSGRCSASPRPLSWPAIPVC